MKFEHSSPAVPYSDPILAKIGLDICRDIEVENPKLLREIKNVEEVIFSKKPNSDKLKRIKDEVIEEIKERIKVLENTEKLETKEKAKITKCIILENKMLISLIKQNYEK